MEKVSSATYRDRRATLLTWLIIGITGISGYLAVVLTKPIFTPDSQFYLARAFLFSGMSREQARDATIEFATAFPTVGVTDIDALFSGAVVGPRVVLSALAAPFVAVFGPLGLAVVTGLLTAAVTIILSAILIRRYGNTAAITVMVLMHCSIYLMWFNSAMLTESASMLWSILILLSAWAYVRTRSVGWLVALAGLTLVAAFTRQATLIPAGALVAAWLLGALITRSRSPLQWPALVVAATTIVAQVVQNVVFSSLSLTSAMANQTGATSAGDALPALIRRMAAVLFSDVSTFVSLDRALLAIIVLATLGTLFFWRRTESHLLFGALLGIAVYFVVNPTPTAFRYAMPGFVFFALAAGMLLAEIGQRVSQRLRRQGHDVGMLDASGATTEEPR